MRIVFVSVCLVALAAAPAAAQGQAPDVLGQVYACANVSDETERLACYDNAAGRLHEAQTSGNLVAVDRRRAEDLERDAFGFSLPSLSRLFGGGGGGEAGTTASAAAQPPTFARTDELQLEIARVSMRHDGAASFTMTNGQVWSQIDDESPRHARAGGQVTIRRAAMGSFLMSFAAGGPALRVRRTQ